MKLRTSFFDGATSKKDVTRFAPLWVLYTIGLLLFLLPIASDSAYYWTNPAQELCEIIPVFTTLNMMYAVIAASLLFGELFNARQCNALHAMPVTRTARFVSHICTGLAFSFVPNFLAAVLMMFSLEHLWFTALLWLAAVCLQYLFFFGIAVLSVMCTGSRFAMVLVYFILNFLSPLVNWFITMIYLPNMPGVWLDEDAFNLFCPAAKLLMESEYFMIDWNRQLMRPRLADSTFAGFGDSWGYLGIVAAIGVAVLVAAWLLYRCRKLECAGNFIAVEWLKPVFLVLYTFCGGAFLSIFGPGVFLPIGFLIAFFTGKMLLERTTRVFQKKSFLHAGIFALAILLSVGVAKSDMLGIVSYVPEVEDVEYVTVNKSYYGISQDFSSQSYKEQIIEIHEAALENLCDGDCNEDTYHDYIYIEYHMRDGRVVIRAYYLCEGSRAQALLPGIPGN